VLCGQQAGIAEGLVDWSPVAAALKLDQAEFARRVVAAMPLIVRRGLDHAAAERIAQRLQAMQMYARVVPDDSQLAYVRREQGTAGPVPYSALHDFIVAGDSWRLRGSNDWQPWPAVVDNEPAPAALPDLEQVEHREAAQPVDEPAEEFFNESIDDAVEPATETLDEPAAWSPAPADEPEFSTPVAPPADQFPPEHELANEFLSEEHDSSTPLPPPLPEQSSADDLPTPAFAEADAVTLAANSDTPELEDALINPSDEDAASIEAGADAIADPEATYETPPPRSRTGLLIGLLILAGLAYWAYSHWISDTSGGVPPTPTTMVQPTKTAPTVLPAPPTSVAADLAITPASASSSPATTISAADAPVPVESVPASATSAPAAASSATAPASSASAKAPATATSSAAAPAAAGSTIPAPPAPITAAPASESATPQS